MIYAYDEMYLEDAMRNLGECFDYAVNVCDYDADDFLKFFLASGIADGFGAGNPKYICGLSGVELAWEVVLRTGRESGVGCVPGVGVEAGVVPKSDFVRVHVEYEYSPEYWSGWILAYYQWCTGKSFRDIAKFISMKDVLKLYPTLHEASEEKFVDAIDAIIQRKNKRTKLQIQRKISGYSQRDLSEKSGVNLRTLQQYETGAKDIRKASVQVVMDMAKVLGCKVEDIV